MARHWQPKWPVRCIKCGWTGKRTNACIHYKCPKCRCGGASVKKVQREETKDE